MSNFYISLLHLIVLNSKLGQLLAGDSVQCPGTKGKCRCTRTDTSIFCPEGFYCPPYSAEQIIQNGQILLQANCEFNLTSSFVQCPCTPGFYCPENTETPSYCCKGFYCPTPAKIKECGEGNFCKTGYVEEIACGDRRGCPDGSTKSSNNGVIIAILFFLAALYALFLMKNYLENKVREHQKSLVGDAVERKRLIAAERSSDSYEAGVELIEDGNKPVEEVESAGSESAVVKKYEKIPDTVHSAEQTPSDTSFTVKFENMGLTLKNGVCVMRGVHGSFQPKRLCAIMGPSGCGKTTVINLISGKVRKTDGKVFVNGEEVDNLGKWKKLIGFVPQEDVMIRQLTVRQNIEFSAMYRLPVEMPYEEKVNIINETLIALGIDHVQHSVIGDERERGISGGQRKRVNVGLELVAKPKVLFLDEPTSGLDSTSSLSLVKQLKSIAVRQGVTIAGVIHQPSIPTFMEFDDLLLLGKGGRVIYHGPIEDLMGYFQSIGFEPRTYLVNPADFILDVGSGAVPRRDDENFTPRDLFRLWEEKNGFAPADVDPSASDKHRSARVVDVNSPGYLQQLSAELNPLQSVGAAFTASKSFVAYIVHNVISVVERHWEGAVGLVKEVISKDEVRNTPGFFGQFYLCAKRAFFQKYRRFGTFTSQMLIHLLLAVVVGSVSDDLQFVGPLPDVVCAITTQELVGACRRPLVDNYQVVANFLCIGIIFAAISVSASTFGDEQVNYWRENSAGLKTPPYFLAKWLIDVPNIILAATFYSLAFRLSFPNNNSVSVLFELLLAFYAYAWSVGYLISTLAPPKHVFLVGVLFALLLAVAFSGANPTISRVRTFPTSYSWLWSISGPRWMLEAFYVSQVKYYEEVPSGPLEGKDYMDINAGLESTGYNIDNLGKDIRAMYWNAFGWGLCSMLSMIFFNSDKKR